MGLSTSLFYRRFLQIPHSPDSGARHVTAGGRLAGDVRFQAFSQEDYHVVTLTTDFTTPIPQATSAPVLVTPSAEDAAAVAWNGNEYLVVWQNEGNENSIISDLLAHRLAADGTLLDLVPFLIAADVPSAIDSVAESDCRVSVAASSSAFMVAWCKDGVQMRVSPFRSEYA